MRWAGHEANVREIRNAYKISVGKPEKKRQFGRHRHGWEDNIKINF
jgi:hypothetical protein